MPLQEFLCSAVRGSRKKQNVEIKLLTKFLEKRTKTLLCISTHSSSTKEIKRVYDNKTKICRLAKENQKSKEIPEEERGIT